MNEYDNVFFSHLLNEDSPIKVTLDGMIIFSIDDLRKQELPILCSFEFLNTKFPIFATDEGRETLHHYYQ